MTTDKKAEDGWVDVTKINVYPEKVETKDMPSPLSYFVIGGMGFKSNLAVLGEKEFKKQGAKYFLTIIEDIHKFVDAKKNGSCQYSNKMLKNLTEYAKITKNRLAIRGFAYKHSARVVHVLTEDVLEMIPILMERQKREPESYSDELAELEKKWKVGDPNLTRSISTEEFKEIMNEFEVDKSQIVIAIDIQSYLTTVQTLYYGTGPITTYNRDGELIMTAHQALFYIFRSTIYGYNWRDLKKSEFVQKKFDAYYKFFEEVTKKYWEMEHGLLVNLSLVKKDIKTLKDHTIFTKKWAKKARLYPYENSKYDDKIKTAYLANDCVNLGTLCVTRSSFSDNVPVHIARANVHHGFVGMFFPDNVAEQKMVLVDGLLTVMDFQFRRSYRKMLQEIIYKKAGMEEPECSSESELEDEDDAEDEEEEDEDEDEYEDEEEVEDEDDAEDEEEEVEDEDDAEVVIHDTAGMEVPEVSSDADSCSIITSSDEDDCSRNDHSTMCMMVPEDFNLATAVEKNQTFKIVFTCCGPVKLVPFTPPPPKPKVIAHPVFNDRCNQCFENLGKMKAAQSELKNSEKKAKLYEKQAMKTQELEKEMVILETKRRNADEHRQKAGEDMEKAVNLATKNEKKAQKADELEQKLKEKNAKLGENKKEIDKLRRTLESQPNLAQNIVTLKGRLANREVIENKLRESNKALQSQNSDLKKKLESQSLSNELYQKHFADKYGKMQDEMAENRKLSDEIVTQNSILTKENSQLKATLMSEKAAAERNSDVNARLLNEKVQLHQKIKDLERQLQKFNVESGSQ